MLPALSPRDLIAFRPGPVTFWTLFVYLIVFIPLLYIEEVVPAPPRDLPSSVNLTEAWEDLQNITNAFHPFNSHDNDRVRSFFLNRVKEILCRNQISYAVESLRATATNPTSNAYGGTSNQYRSGSNTNE